MNRRLRSKLDFLFPVPSEKVEKQQLKQKLSHYNTKPLRTFKVGEKVYSEMFGSTPNTWLPRVVTTVMVRCLILLSYKMVVQ